MALAEGARVELLVGDRVEPGCIGSRATGTAGRDGDQPPRERVDPQGGAQELLGRSRNGVSRSIGAGKTIVVDCEEPSSSSVCR